MVCDYDEVWRTDFHSTCLNPYSIGIWSATRDCYTTDIVGCVLILILLEYGLRRVLSCSLTKSQLVLILILLEYGLRRVQWNHICPHGVGS